MFEEHRFRSSLTGLGITHDPEVYSSLFEAYCNPLRHYHGTKHVSECLTHLDKYRHLAVRPCEIEVAIWFHDAVYDTTRVDNEEKSADWAADFLGSSGVDSDVIERVSEMILATKNHEVSGTDAALMVDIDLIILGSPSDVFEMYDLAIRQEFQWVPEEQYRTARAQVLTKFLKRDVIYQTRLLRVTYEDQARKNLASKINELVSKDGRG
jgi:predicted metal-dependent HD superfamily phosphohydrolase